MKRLAVFLLAVLLMAALLGTFTTAFAATEMYVDTANHKGLYLRSDYTKNPDNIILSIPYRAKVTILEFVDSDYWAYVNYNGNYGWCMTRYLSNTRPAAGGGGSSGGGSSSGKTTGDVYKNFKSADYYAVVKPSTPGGHVNLRWGPSKSLSIHSVSYEGDSVRVIAENGSWCQVLDEESLTCGFMMKSFLSTY